MVSISLYIQLNTIDKSLNILSILKCFFLSIYLLKWIVYLLSHLLPAIFFVKERKDEQRIDSEASSNATMQEGLLATELQS